MSDHNEWVQLIRDIVRLELKHSEEGEGYELTSGYLAEYNELERRVGRLEEKTGR